MTNASAVSESDSVMEQKEAQLADLAATLKRVQADFENFVKRTEKTRQFEARAGQAALLSDLLSVLDSLDAAMRNGDADPGLLKVRQQFEKVLGQYGVRAVDALHRPFDPVCMEVLTESADSAFDDGIVIEVVSNGYFLGDALLRPARVVVNNRSRSAANEKEQP